MGVWLYYCMSGCFPQLKEASDKLVKQQVDQTDISPFKQAGCYNHFMLLYQTGLRLPHPCPLCSASKCAFLSIDGEDINDREATRIRKLWAEFSSSLSRQCNNQEQIKPLYGQTKERKAGSTEWSCKNLEGLLNERAMEVCLPPLRLLWKWRGKEEEWTVLSEGQIKELAEHHKALACYSTIFSC